MRILERPDPVQARRVAPFAAVSLAAVSITALPPESNTSAVWAVAAGLTVFFCAVGFLTPWRRLPPWGRALPAFGYFAVVALMRHADGGTGSAFAPLVLLPILWLAIYGTPRLLYAGLAATLAVFLLPFLILGGPAYHEEDVEIGVLWVVLGAVMGRAVQTLVAQNRQRRVILSAILRAGRTITMGGRTRANVCEAVRDVTGGDLVLLYEPRGERHLAISASSGTHVGEGTVELGGEPSAAAAVYVSGRRLFVPDVPSSPVVSQRIARAVGALSALVEPVERDGRCIAVIIVAWRTPHRKVEPYLLEAMEALAADAAVAIERGDHVEQAETAAHTDGLTGIGNRRHWDEELVQAAARAGRDSAPLSVAVLDLDRFKAFNDSRGHAAGDDLLRATAEAWRHAVRTTDTLCRNGGEEFGLLLPRCPLQEATRIVETLRPLVTHGQTCSAGVTTWDGREPVADAVERADHALYDAKRAGRDCTVSLPPPAERPALQLA